jgi:hypothetical protein
MQPHILSGSNLGKLVEVVFRDHAGHRVAAGHRMIWPKNYR